MILGLILAISFFEGALIVGYWDVWDTYERGLNFFNPCINYYKYWTKMNWFGVLFFTLILNITCPVYSVMYWFYKLCTIRRR